MVEMVAWSVTHCHPPEGVFFARVAETALRCRCRQVRRHGQRLAVRDWGGVAKLRDSIYSVLDDDNFDLVHEADGEETKSLEGATASSMKALDLEARDETGMARLHHAVCERNSSLVKSLVDHGVN